MFDPTTASDKAFSRDPGTDGAQRGHSSRRGRAPAHPVPSFHKDYSPSGAKQAVEMETDQRRFGVGPRTLAGASVVAVVFGISAVLFGGSAVRGVGALAVMASAVALLLSVGQYLGD
jgi:hypothetical protein